MFSSSCKLSVRKFYAVCKTKGKTVALYAGLSPDRSKQPTNQLQGAELTFVQAIKNFHFF
jgi:hypothetical protein